MQTNPPCQKCGEKTLQKGSVPSLDNEPAQRIFECETCGELTWEAAPRSEADQR